MARGRSLTAHRAAMDTTVLSPNYMSSGGLPNEAAGWYRATLLLSWAILPPVYSRNTLLKQTKILFKSTALGLRAFQRPSVSWCTVQINLMTLEVSSNLSDSKSKKSATAASTTLKAVLLVSPAWCTQIEMRVLSLSILLPQLWNSLLLHSQHFKWILQQRWKNSMQIYFS